MAATRDYYEILEVARDASEEDIKKAYRRQALKNHPDRNPGDAAAAERFKEAAEAYEVLGDGEKRRVYDQYGHEGLRGRGFSGAGVDPRDIFESIFGAGSGLSDLFGGLFGGGGGGRHGPRQGSHLRVGLRIPLKDAFTGSERTITLSRHETCESCQGSGARKGTSPQRCSTCGGHGQVQRSQGFFVMQTTCPTCRGAGEVIRDPCADCHGNGRVPQEREIRVRIPKGVPSGSQLRLAGEGEPGDRGGPRGDLFVVVEIEPHSLFERDGDDLLCEVPVSYSQAALGAEIEVPTLAGRAALKVPGGTPSGKVFRLKNQGMPSVYGRGQGDLLARVVVDVPRKLTARQRELLEELAQLDGDAVSPQRRTFLDKVKDLLQ